MLAAFGGIIVALAVCEAAVRLYFHEPLLPIVPPEPYIDNAVLYRRSANRLYELRPGVDAIVGRKHIHIHTNAAGLRDDRDVPREKASEVYRVVALGDSFTFGGKVDLNDTFPRVLERELQASDSSRRYEALNLAVPGYNTTQEMLSLKEVGLAYHPDLVILNFVLNDAAPMRQLVPQERRLPLWVCRPLKRFDLVQFVYVSSKQLSFMRRRTTFREADDHADLAAQSPGWEDAKAALAEIQRLSAENGAHLLVVVWPMLVDLSDYPHRGKHQLVVTACRRLRIPVFDLLPTFEGRDSSTLWAMRSDHHPNALALKMAARAVLEALENQGWVQPAAERHRVAEREDARGAGRRRVPGLAVAQSPGVD